MDNMINYIYRKLIVNKFTHEQKMRLCSFFYKIPGFKHILINQFDYRPEISVDELGIQELSEEDKKKYYIDSITKMEGNSELNDLEKFYLYESHKLFSKHIRYFKVYDRYLSKFRGKENVTILEVGVFKGGSLQMWKHYFGDKCNVIGLDIDEKCLQYAENQIKVYIGDQADRKLWKKIKDENPRIDIIIDDGGHTMQQQIVTFEEMYDFISKDGIYICEDCATSYWPSMGGGYGVKESFIEYSKKCIDYIHANYSKTKKLQKNHITETLYGIHFYDQMVVFEKRPNMEENDTIIIENK